MGPANFNGSVLKGLRHDLRFKKLFFMYKMVHWRILNDKIIDQNIECYSQVTSEIQT